jgi:RNase P protein component
MKINSTYQKTFKVFEGRKDVYAIAYKKKMGPSVFLLFAKTKVEKASARNHVNVVPI